MSAPQNTEATLAMLYKAIARMPGNVDAMVGLAGTHLQAEQLSEAADWCMRAFALEQSQRVARMQAAVGDAFVKRALREMIEGRMDDAMETLAKAPGRTARRYRDLLLTATQWFKEAHS